MATSFLRMGRICCGLKSFQVNTCASRNRIPAVAFSTKFGDLRTPPRKTHIKKAKPKPKLDVAQLLLSLGMRPAARPSSATRSAITDAPKPTAPAGIIIEPGHTKPTAPAARATGASPSVAASAPAPVTVTPPAPPPGPTLAMDSAASTHLPISGPYFPSVPSTDAPVELDSTSPPPVSASLQAEPKTSPALEHPVSLQGEPTARVASEVLSARVFTPLNPAEQTEPESAASCEFASQKAAAALDVAVQEALAPSELPPVAAVDSTALSEPTAVSDVEFITPSEPSPHTAIDSTALSGSPPTDSFSQTGSSSRTGEVTAPHEDVTMVIPAVTETIVVPEEVSMVMGARTAPENVTVGCTPGVTEAVTAPEELTVGFTPGVTKAITTEEKTLSGSTLGTTADLEMISHESTAGVATPVDLDSEVLPTIEVSPASDSVHEYTPAGEVPSVRAAVSDDGNLELSTLSGSTTGELESSESALSASEAVSLETDTIKVYFSQDAEVKQPIITGHVAIAEDGASTSSVIPSEEDVSLHETAILLGDVAVPDLTGHVEALSLLEAASFLDTVPTPKITTQDVSPVHSTLSKNDTPLEVGGELEIAPFLENSSLPDLTPHLEAVSLLEVASFLETVPVPETTEASEAAAEPKSSLEDVALPDLTSSLEAVSLIEVGMFLEDISAPEEAASLPGVSSSQADVNDSLPAVDTISLLEVAPELEHAAVPDLTPHLEAVSLLQVAQFLEAMPSTDVTAVTCENVPPGVSAGEDVTPPQEGIAPPKAGLPLESMSALAAGGMSPELLYAAGSLQSNPVPEDVTTTTSTIPVLSHIAASTSPHPITATTPLYPVPKDIITTTPTDPVHGNVITTTPKDPVHGDVITTATTKATAADIAATTPTDPVHEDVITTTLTDAVPLNIASISPTAAVATDNATTASSDSVPAAIATTTITGPAPGDIASTTPSDPMLAMASVDVTSVPSSEMTFQDAVTTCDGAAHVPQVAPDVTDESSAAQDPLPDMAQSLTQPAPSTGCPLEIQEGLEDIQVEMFTEELTQAEVPTEELTQGSTEAGLDPVQALFLEKIREYAAHSRAAGGVVEAGSEFQRRLAEEEAKLQRLYGGCNLSEFPEFTFPEPKLDEVTAK